MRKLSFSDFFCGIESTCLEELLEIGKAFASLCHVNKSIALVGDLGSGKTSFVKGIGTHWNIDTIKSPTFNIMDVHYGDITLLHIDAYRLKQVRNYDSLALEDHLIPPFLLAVEWPEFLPTIQYDFTLDFDILPSSTFVVKLRDS